MVKFTVTVDFEGRYYQTNVLAHKDTAKEEIMQLARSQVKKQWKNWEAGFVLETCFRSIKRILFNNKLFVTTIPLPLYSSLKKGHINFLLSKEVYMSFYFVHR